MNKYLLSLLMFFCGAPAFASDMYVGAKLGSTTYDYSGIMNNGQSSFGLLLGARVSPNAALEVEYHDLGGFEGTTTIVTGKAFSLSGVASATLSRELSLFGKLGISSTTLSEDAKPGFAGGTVTYNNLGLNFGLGAQFNVSPFVGVRVGLDSFRVGNQSPAPPTRARLVYVGGVFQF
jgi:opacity protein-like surface antigen